ncbi:FKBP-type peptidyl-prolyl cis-trans isomerase [Oleiharenicola lentus]|uniref:FKBP-type peptidyl-prolyl cis-trans isomerase n=1 Tax=Oleiharenicola lentus TaxID=2508720 RepID=UPI003F66660C
MSRLHVSFHYTLKDADGRMLDTSRGGEPAGFVEAVGQVIEGLEAALLQMKPGEQRSIVVPPEHGYGDPDPAMVQKVPRAHLPVDDIKAGDQFQTGADRQAPVVTVLAIEGDEVLLDANHPLAGRTLYFDIECVTKRPATREELQRAADSQ